MAERKSPNEDIDLSKHVRDLLADKDLMQDYWEQGHGHLWNKTWQKITSAIGSWILAAIGAGLFSALMVYGVQNGWFK